MSGYWKMTNSDVSQDTMNLLNVSRDTMNLLNVSSYHGKRALGKFKNDAIQTAPFGSIPVAMFRYIVDNSIVYIHQAFVDYHLTGERYKHSRELRMIGWRGVPVDFAMNPANYQR